MERYHHAGLTFDVQDDGPPDGDAVVLLHGFPQTSASWEGVSALLTKEGYRTLAPDQRGYSPGARPRGRRAYRMSELVGDVVALLDAAGLERAHIVGHDWGGGAAWGMAQAHPDRVRTLTSLSTPHPAAFARAMVTSTQLLRSWYMLAFQIPWVPEAALARDPERFTKQLMASGLSEDKAKRYTDKMLEPGGLTGGLNWYRGIPFGRAQEPVGVPTLFIWSSGDRFVSRGAAEGTRRYVTGPYRGVELEGDHWLPDNQAERVVELLLPHLGQG
jgi:pimeloyl-ACP methyl ester carboxylesterase